MFSTTAASTSCKGIHLNHPRDSDACKPGNPTHSAEPSGNQGQQCQSRGLPTSFLVVDDQEAGPSRPLMVILMPTKHFNPPSVASATGDKRQHIRTLKPLQKYTYSAELPTDQHTAAVFTN